MPEITKPVTDIPAKEASISGGKGSGSNGIPTSARAWLDALPITLHIVELTMTLHLIAGY